MTMPHPLTGVFALLFGALTAHHGKSSRITVEQPQNPLSDSSGLERLRELTAALDERTHFSGPNRVDYEVSGGECYGFCLINNGKIAVQRVIMSAGVRFPRHAHTQTEWLIPYDGTLALRKLGGERFHEIKPGESYYFVPGEGHEVEAVTDCEFLAVTVPPSEIYPHGR